MMQKARVKRDVRLGLIGFSLSFLQAIIEFSGKNLKPKGGHGAGGMMKTSRGAGASKEEAGYS
jgi:hypothetical protein